MPLVPDIVRQLVGNLFGIRLICFRSRHHDDAAAGDVSVVTDVADMPGTAQNPRILFQFIEILIDRTHRLIRRYALFPAQNHRQLAVHGMNVLAVLDQIADHLRHLPPCIAGISVRGLAVAADRGRRFDIVLTQIAVRIAGHRDRDVRSDEVTDRLEDVMIARAQAVDLARAVKHQIDSVDFMQMLAHRIEEACFDVVERVALDHA